MRDPRRAGPRRAELRQHAAGRDRDEQAPAETLGVPNFDVQRFVNMLRDMAKTSRPRPEILDVLDLDAQSFAHTLRAMAKTRRPPLPEILDVPPPPGRQGPLRPPLQASPYTRL